MSAILTHVQGWKRALDAKAITDKNDPKQGLIDTVIGFERKQAWLELTREAMELPDPYHSLALGLALYLPPSKAREIATKLLSLACAEDEGLEVTVEMFNNIFNLSEGGTSQ